MSTSVYSIDASGLIAGWANYPFENFSTVWLRLEDLVREGRFRIAQEVYNELKPKDEKLYDWLKKIKSAIVPLDEEQQRFVTHITNTYKNLVNALTGKSANDPFVLALAMQIGIENAIVITDERPTGNLNGPKIPDVCKAEGIEWRRFVEIIVREGWSF